MLLVNQMNDLLQTCKTKEEAYQVISLALGELFTGQSGGLAILHNSGNFLETFHNLGKRTDISTCIFVERLLGNAARQAA